MLETAAPPPENIIHTRDLTKTFANKTVVNNLNLDIPPGVIFGFIGPSGCRKTTSVRLLLGIYTPDSGEVEVLGRRWIEFVPEEERAAVLEQHARLSQAPEILEYEHSVVFADGNVRCFHWAEVSLFDAQGQCTEIQSAGRDVTEQRQAEAALRSREQRVRDIAFTSADWSCVAAAHRGGPGMLLLWEGLAEYVLERDIEILFGAASFPGVDPAPLAEALSFLHHRHLGPPELRVRARAERYVPMDLTPPEAIDPARALAAIPSLIKAYLRLGGAVGEGAVIDRDFNTVDVCLVMDTARMKAQARAFYARGRGGAG